MSRGKMIECRTFRRANPNSATPQPHRAPDTPAEHQQARNHNGLHNTLDKRFRMLLPTRGSCPPQTAR